MNYQKIYKKLREIRVEKGLSQKSLGEKCGLTQQAINRIEQGQRKIDVDLLLRMSDALNVPVSEILSYDDMIGDITSSGTIVYMEADMVEYKRIIDKQKSGDGFTPYDIRFVSDYIKKDAKIREWFVINGLKSHEENMRNIQSSYEQLNEEGRKEAAKRIGELAEIERYTKPDGWFQGKCSEKELHEAVEKLTLPPQVGEI